ncbi:MAG: transposase [Flavobacteriaceae bacterium]
MDILHDFFSDIVGIKAPYTLSSIDKAIKKGVIVDITFTISIASDYRPSKYHVLHSYYEKRWQHLNLFQYPCFISARLPVFLDKRTGKTSVIAVPWARKNSGFTLLFEQAVLELLRLCHCKKVTADYFGIYAQRVTTIYDAYTKDKYEQREPAVASKIGVDETSTKKGHQYITLFVDLENAQILDIQDGRSSQCVKLYAEELKMLGKKTTAIKDFSLDMSPAFISGIKKHFPKVRMTYDRFHVVQLVNKYFKPLWKSKKIDKEELAFHRKEFDKLWTQTNCKEANAFFTYWLERTKDLFTMKNFCKSMNKHFNNIINFTESKVTNGLLEGMNSKIQCIRKIARGYKHNDNLKRMILFAFGQI